MLQNLQITQRYAQPLSPMTVDGDVHTLPSDFVDGLSFLRPFIKRRGRDLDIECRVHLSLGQPIVVTNNLIVEYEVEANDLPDTGFFAETIRLLEAFPTAPVQVTSSNTHLHFIWSNKQRLRVAKPESCFSASGGRRATEAFGHCWKFEHGTKIDDETRKVLRKNHGGTKPVDDVYVNGEFVHTHLQDKEGKLSSEMVTPFECNAGRVMRFNRTAFLDMMKVANEIDFSTSPICFKHPNGRGLLMERTLGPFVPDFEGWNDDVA